MGGQADLGSRFAGVAVGSPGAPPATDERAALLAFLHDFTSSAPIAAPMATNSPASWPVAPEDDPSYDPSGAASSHAFLSRFAAAACTPQPTSLLTPLPDPFWEPVRSRPASTRRRTAPAKGGPVDEELTTPPGEVAAPDAQGLPKAPSEPKTTERHPQAEIVPAEAVATTGEPTVGEPTVDEPTVGEPTVDEQGTAALLANYAAESNYLVADQAAVATTLPRPWGPGTPASSGNPSTSTLARTGPPDPFFSLAPKPVTGAALSGGRSAAGAPGRAAWAPPASPEPLPVGTQPLPASPATPLATSGPEEAGVRETGSGEAGTAGSGPDLSPSSLGTRPEELPAPAARGGRHPRRGRRVPVIIGSVALLTALVAVGVAIVSSSSATAPGREKVHLAGPLARADGGLAGPGGRAVPGGQAGSAPAPTAPALLAARQAPAGLCQDSAPPGASPATLAYIAASNAVVPQWTAVSRAMGENGGKARPQEFLSEINADSQLLDHLDEIRFPGRTAVLAADFETSLWEYVLQLGRMIHQGATAPATATLERLYLRRAATSSVLRSALGLSPRYACQWLLPGTDLGT